MLDAYLPPDSDTREKRPAFVYIHGGAFKYGSNKVPDVVEFTRKLAMRGYAVFSINYRLMATYWQNPATYKPQGSEYDAMEDLRAAIRFVRSKAEEYNLDTDKVIAAGDSAGGITSMYTAYVKNA